MQAVAESCVGESPDPKAENGDQQKKDEPEDVDEKPPPEKKRKKSSDSVPKAKQAAAKKQEKAEPKKKQEKTEKAEPKKIDTKDAAKVTKPKVKYDMPGQTQPTPSTGEPLAKFYMSLLKQKPDSEIAPKWCVLMSQDFSHCSAHTAVYLYCWHAVVTLIAIRACCRKRKKLMACVPMCGTIQVLFVHKEA